MAGRAAAALRALGGCVPCPLTLDQTSVHHDRANKASITSVCLAAALPCALTLEDVCGGNREEGLGLAALLRVRCDIGSNAPGGACQGKCAEGNCKPLPSEALLGDSTTRTRDTHFRGVVASDCASRVTILLSAVAAAT